MMLQIWSAREARQTLADAPMVSLGPVHVGDRDKGYGDELVVSVLDSEGRVTQNICVNSKDYRSLCELAAELESRKSPARQQALAEYRRLGRLWEFQPYE